MLIGIPARRLLIERRSAGLEAVGTATGDWAVMTPPDSASHPWDVAHQTVRQPSMVGLESVRAPHYAEPDFIQAFPFPKPDGGGFEGSGGPCNDSGPDAFWPVGSPRHGWHLDAEHSQLKAARDRVGDSAAARSVRVAHLDTGFDPNHPSRPINLRVDLARNFVDGDSTDATDPGRHSLGASPGHGTATLALLAGNRVQVPQTGFDDLLGGAPYVEAVPVRIANSVIHFATSSMAAGINYAVDVGAAVVTLSMGGVPARAWAAAVNRAYESGVAMFAAAGNRFGPTPPATIIWPARFGRVTAVCGATADQTPYYKVGLHRHMQGCFGPPAKMHTALAAYTPNDPWALMGCGAMVGFGGGTSSATPQAAAAAALWLAAYPAPAGAAAWQRVEAVRSALFSSADRSQADTETYFGQGLLKAAAALEKPFRTDLPPAPADDVTFPWLRILGGLEAATPIDGVEQMYEVEALQVYLVTPQLQTIAGGADPITDDLPAAERRVLFRRMRESPRISRALRSRLDAVLQ
jgi:subtilisin family serine protease